MTRPPVRVLAVSSYGVLGGAELSVASFVERRDAGVSVDAVLLSDGPLRERLEAHGVRVGSARGLDGPPGARELGRFARTLAARLQEARPDVVWAVGQKAALLCAGPCRLHGVPLAWHKVDFSWDRELAVALGAAATGVIGASRAVTLPLGVLAARRVVAVVPPPVQVPPGLSALPDPDRPLIGTLGRLIPYKGQHHILHAAAIVADEVPALRVVLAGEESPDHPGYAAALHDLAHRLGIADRVSFPGFVPAEDVLGKMSVFVGATHRDEHGFGLEGFGAGMVEASWAGVPVVAVEGGGVAEAVLDGVTGTLVPRADPRLLAAGILRYLRDPALAARDGGRGRERAHRAFSAEVLAPRLFAALRTIAARGSRGE